MTQLHQLDLTQWWTSDQLGARQFEQLGLLSRYAETHSSFYRSRFADAHINTKRPWTAETLQRMPILSRHELQTEAEGIDCREVPKTHGNVSEIQTSGSTGQVVKVKRTGVTHLKWLAFTMREHLWHRRDYNQTLAVVRAHAPTLDDDNAANANGWGPPATLLYKTGPCYSLPLDLDVRQQAKWLLRRNPGYLLTYPTNLRGLLEEFEQLGETPSSLLEARTIGETVAPDLPSHCRAVLGVPLIDSYSSREVGAIAAMCPETGLYHVQAESLIVEVMDDAGRPCQAGQVGRVVVTDLHNFATPLIRYELRDYAEVAGPCACGRGLPTLKRITGRERNMVRLPTGERFWPLLGYPRFREVAPVLQYQVTQNGLSEIEVRLVVSNGKLTVEQEERLTGIVQNAIGYPFAVRFTYFPTEIPRSPGGKFEEFMCLV